MIQYGWYLRFTDEKKESPHWPVESEGSLHGLRYYSVLLEDLLCCFIGICFPTLQRRSTPELILKIEISVSNQGRIPNFHDSGHLCPMLIIEWYDRKDMTMSEDRIPSASVHVGLVQIVLPTRTAD